MQEIKYNLNLKTQTQLAVSIENVKNEKNIYEFFKRIFDLVVSLVLFIIAVPITLVACLCVVLESKGNPIYSQERLGKNGKSFKVYKIRSMYIDAEKHTGAKWADKNDPRVTKVGKFIRKTRIDELPQIINILLGDMTIVGPRPERPIFTYKFNEEIPGFINRLQVKPGLTGLAQINGGYDITPKEKLEFDMKYIENRGFGLDIKIMLKTALIVITGEGAR